MKLSALLVFNLFNIASGFEYTVSKLSSGGYQLDLTIGYMTTYIGRNVPDNISLLVDVDDDDDVQVNFLDYNFFMMQLEEALQKKEQQRVKDARRKELLTSMSKEDKELLGIK